jgi:hypothetical protein
MSDKIAHKSTKNDKISRTSMKQGNTTCEKPMRSIKPPIDEIQSMTLAASSSDGRLQCDLKVQCNGAVYTKPMTLENIAEFNAWIAYHVTVNQGVTAVKGQQNNAARGQDIGFRGLKRRYMDVKREMTEISQHQGGPEAPINLDEVHKVQDAKARYANFPMQEEEGFRARVRGDALQRFYTWARQQNGL